MMRPNQAETVLSVVSHSLVPQCPCTDVHVHTYVESYT